MSEHIVTHMLALMSANAELLPEWFHADMQNQICRKKGCSRIDYCDWDLDFVCVNCHLAYEKC